MFKLNRFAFLAAIALTSVAQIAQADAILTSGDVRIGVQSRGALGVGGVGISLSGVGDGITPGCLCEGWGASADAFSGWSANANGGNSNISLVSFASTSSTASSVVKIGALQIQQDYAPSTASGLFKDTVTLTNTSGASFADVRYSRSMDWDIPPTAFNEYVTINRGTAENLVFSNDNGFATPNPLSNPSVIMAGTNNVSFTDLGPRDHGAFFTFAFGALAAGESRTFNIFYGAARSESSALNALATVGAEVYSLGQSGGGGQLTGSPATYVFGFTGVGGDPILPAVPEPETYAMLLSGLGLMAGFARRRKKQLAA
jgi:hypothetical protein